MEPITLTAIAFFLTPYLHKAGDKIAEKTVETLFESRKDLADGFKELFYDDIISLGLSESATGEDITKQLEAKPEMKAQIQKKVSDNQDLLNELVEAFKEMKIEEFGGIEINAEKIAQVNVNAQKVEQNIENF